MAHTWTDPTGATVTIYSVDGVAGVMTLDNVDNEGTQILAGLDLEECEITFEMDWTSGGSGVLTPRVYYRASEDLSTFFMVEFSVTLDLLSQDEITSITLHNETGVVDVATVSKTHTIGVPFNVKVRSTQNQFVKVWSSDQQEPADWDLATGSGSSRSGTVGLAGFAALDAVVPDPLTPIWFSGFEAGHLTGADSNSTNASANLYSSSSNVAISAAGQGRDGVGYAIRCLLTTVNQSANFVVSSTYLGGSCTQFTLVGYFRIETALPSANFDLITWDVTGGTDGFLRFRQSDSRLLFVPNNSGTDRAGPVITFGVWYRLDITYTATPTAFTYQWAVDGVAQTDVTGTATNQVMTNIYFGHRSGTSPNVNFDWDDCLVTLLPADYPIGELAIYPLLADSPATEVGTANATARFQANGGILDSTFVSADIITAISSPTVSPSGSVDGVYQRTSGVGNFISVPIENYTLGAGEGVGSVRVELAPGWSASLAANNVSLLANVGASDETLFALANPGFSNSITAPPWMCRIYNASGGWDQTKLNALRVIFGGSNDISPQPGINYLVVEVAIRTAADASSSTIDLLFDNLQVCSCELEG